MAHHPTHVGGGPKYISRIHVVNGFHGVVEGHRMAAVVAHNTLGFARSAGGIENIQRIGGEYRNCLHHIISNFCLGH